MRLFISVLLLIYPGPVAGSPSEADEQARLDFDLEDQFENAHRSSDVLGNIVLLIGSDKGGTKFNESWGEAISETVRGHPRYDRISHLSYADLRGVPFFLKGFIRGKFPQNPDQWVLMDWKGAIAKTYEFTAKSSNILIFAPDGSLTHHAAGREPDDETVREVVGALRRLLDEVR